MPDGNAPAPTGDLNSILLSNLTGVQSQIAAAARAHGRPEPDLVAVTKSVPAAVAIALHRLGCADLAENRAPAFLEKVEAFGAMGLHPTWHFIGHVQRNKARRILEHADVLHSVDSLRLAESITRLLSELNRSVGLFLEVNLTGENQKHGLAPQELPEALAVLSQTPHAQVLGLMAMGPLQERCGKTTDEVFAEANRLAAEIEASHGNLLVDGVCRLSMGMSGDLDEAIHHGSTHVRVGSSLFQSTQPPRPSAPAAPSQ